MSQSFNARIVKPETLRQMLSDSTDQNNSNVTTLDAPANIDLTDIIRNKLVESEGSRIAKAFYDSEVRKELETRIKQILIVDKMDLKGRDILDVAKQLVNEIVGGGPIDPFLKRTDINEIMINCYNEVFVDEPGKGIIKTDVRFDSEEHLMSITRKMLNIANVSVNTANPYVNARLPGMRLNVVIPPISLRGTTVTIRRYADLSYSEEETIDSGLMNQSMLSMLKVAIKYKASIFITGGTGSGKTTLLKLLSKFIPDQERIITIEDDEELRLYELYPEKHIVALECRLTNREDTTVTITKLVKNGLRMNPDRSIVGEVRGEEALDLLESLNTGHGGSLASGHANNAMDAGERLITMVQRKPGLNMTPSEIGRIVAKGFHLFVHLKRLKDYSRKMMQIVEVKGYKDGMFQMNEMYKFEMDGEDKLSTNGKVKGEHVDVQPYFSEELVQYLIDNGAPFSEIEPWIRKE